MLRSAFVVSTLLAVAGASTVATEIPRHGHSDARLTTHADIRLTTHGVSYTPGIRVWTSGSDLHRRGDRVRLYYRTERDAFVMIYRVNTDGRVQVLFPRTPDDDNYGSAGATYSVAGDDPNSGFYVDDDPGVGYIFGVAAVDQFDFREIAVDGQWDLHGISDGRIHGDPRSSMEEMVQTLMPYDYGNFDTHIVPYYVERRYDYPRFVCYDCHTQVPYAYWDPYSAWCRSYTLTVFNDPYYYYPSYWYPATYYGGTRVVYAQPGGSRYVFKNRDNASAPGVDYRDRRYTPNTPATDARRPEGRGVRGTDLGGTGSVPAPRTPMRREAPPLANGGGSGGGGGGEQPREPRTNDPRRTVNADSPMQQDLPGRSQPGTTAPDAGGRRRMDAQPGIQIVPRSESQSSPDARRGEAGGYGNEPRPSRPAQRESVSPSTRAEIVMPRDYRPDAPAESRPTRQAETRPDARQQESRPDVRQPENRPEARQPVSRPEARQPESRQPEARQPEARQPSAPQASPPRESRPEPRPQAQAQPRSQPQSQPHSQGQGGSSRGSDPGLVRRRP